MMSSEMRDTAPTISGPDIQFLLGAKTNFSHLTYVKHHTLSLTNTLDFLRSSTSASIEELDLSIINHHHRRGSLRPSASVSVAFRFGTELAVPWVLARRSHPPSSSSPSTSIHPVERFRQRHGRWCEPGRRRVAITIWAGRKSFWRVKVGKA